MAYQIAPVLNVCVILVTVDVFNSVVFQYTGFNDDLDQLDVRLDFYCRNDLVAGYRLLGPDRLRPNFSHI